MKIKNDFDLALISDAPRVWINRVLKELGIENIFKDKIFSGEGNTRKEFNNAFEKVIKILNIKPECCIVFGDQEKTDIIPAKKLGMKTVLVSREKKPTEADYSIRNILEIERLLNLLK